MALDQEGSRTLWPHLPGEQHKLGLPWSCTGPFRLYNKICLWTEATPRFRRLTYLVSNVTLAWHSYALGQSGLVAAELAWQAPFKSPFKLRTKVPWFFECVRRPCQALVIGCNSLAMVPMSCLTYGYTQLLCQTIGAVALGFT